MLVDDSTTAVVPRSEENTTLAAVMLNILERTHQEWDAAKQADEANHCCPASAEILVRCSYLVEQTLEIAQMGIE